MRPRQFKLRMTPGPTEAQEQMQVVRWLEFRGYVFFHPANGEARSIQTGRKLKQMGVRRGVPDLFILTPPPNMPEARGCAIEMKNVHGGKLSPEQAAWLTTMRAIGWQAMACHGSAEAITQLMALGY